MDLILCTRRFVNFTKKARKVPQKFRKTSQPNKNTTSHEFYEHIPSQDFSRCLQSKKIEQQTESSYEGKVDMWY